MRLFIRVFLCGFCIGVSCFFFMRQPLQKYVNGSEYLVFNKSPTGITDSIDSSTGESLNKSENFGYGCAILLFGCTLVMGITHKEKSINEKIVPKNILIFGAFVLLYATFTISRLTFYALLFKGFNLFIFPMLLVGFMLSITGAGLLSLKKWAWELSLILFSVFLVLSIYSFISHGVLYSLIFAGVWASIILYLFLIKRQYREFSRL